MISRSDDQPKTRPALKRNRPAPRSGCAKNQRSIARRHLDLRTRAELTAEDSLRERVFDLLLDRALKWSRPIHRIESRLSKLIHGRRVERELDVAIGQTLTQITELDIHDGA